MKVIRRILLLIVVAAAALAALVYLFGPHAQLAQAFNTYRAAYLAGDRNLVTRLTAPEAVARADVVRQLALTAPRAAVEALDFSRRAAVLGLRKQVRDGKLPLTLLQSADPITMYAALEPMEARAKTFQTATVILAMPTGPNTARGYLDLAYAGKPEFMAYSMALGFGIYLNFVRSYDGTWLVDPTALVDSSARENEYWAKQVEPTGNTFLITSLLQENDPAKAELLWQPLSTP
ncbi:hypothetical protein [Aestuariivirga sp.]|uniref:hypothetical protein n=1 Tax=Aestuariivirga sp. TaxID=2650926 RepID=UPI0039E5C0EB